MPKIKDKPAISTNDLTDRITTISTDLDAAKADVALLKRLKDAETNVKRLVRELKDTQESLATAIADEHEAKQQADFANIRNMTITATEPVGVTNPGLLKTTFAVHYEMLSYDYSTRQNVWRATSAFGINYLQARELAYLTKAKPEIIPQLIMDLAPGEPAEAVSRYIQAVRRGYMTT